MPVAVNIEIKESENKGLLGISLGELNGKPLITRKKKRKKRKSHLMEAIESVTPKKSKYTTEVI